MVLIKSGSETCIPYSIFRRIEQGHVKISCVSPFKAGFSTVYPRQKKILARRRVELKAIDNLFRLQHWRTGGSGSCPAPTDDWFSLFCYICLSKRFINRWTAHLTQMHAQTGHCWKQPTTKKTSRSIGVRI